MTRRKTLKVLFVRSSDERALDPTLLFAIRREPASALPVPLLTLASAVKFGTPHRVLVHDARHRGGGAERELRSIAALHHPDVSVVWLHPATLADGLEAARAVRHGGCPLVLGAGPLVDLWPAGAKRIPELDGLLASANAAGLLAAVDGIAGGRSGAELATALESPPAATRFGVDRKLLDYAAYTGVPGPTWSPSTRRSGALLGIGRGSDKGRKATSVIPLHDLAGRLLEPDTVLDDVLGCDLLGIPRLALSPGPGLPAPPLEWWRAAVEVLARAPRAGAGVRRRLRVRVDPAAARALPLLDLVDLGIVSVDLGDIDGGNTAAVADASEAARACRRVGLDAGGTLLLGQPGFSYREDSRGLDAVRASGMRVVVGVTVRVGASDAAVWADWLDAPGADFIPPGVDGDRLQLARRVSRVVGARGRPEDAARGLVRRVRRLLNS